MDVRHLRYFVAVAEERHFGRAAASLHIAQPPLSQQIKQLETELGVQLLARTTRHVSLTPAGVRYLQRSREILAALDEATLEARRVAAGLVGRVAVGFIGTASYTLLPALARRARAELPDLELELRGELLSPDLADAIVDRTLDLAVLRPPVDNPAIELWQLRTEPLVAVLPDGHPLAGRRRLPLRALRAEPFVVHPSRNRSAMFTAVLDACRDAGFVPRELREVSETSTLVSLVAGGLGVALVPASVQHLQITGARYVPLSGRQHRVELALAGRAGEDAPHVDRVRALIVAAAAEV